MVLAVGTCRIGAALWTGLGSPDFILEATRMAGIFSFCFPNTFLSAAAVTAETAGREGEKDTLGKLLYTKAACFAAGISQTSLEFKSSNKTFQENKQKSKKKEGGGGETLKLKIPLSFMPAFHLFPPILFSVLHHCPPCYFCCYLTCSFSFLWLIAVIFFLGNRRLSLHYLVSASPK